MRPSAAIFAVAALVAVVVSRADAEPQRSRQETAAESYGGSSGGGFYQPSPSLCDQRSCYPATGNLLIGREDRLKASSTCGTSTPERFCIVSHLEDRKKCFSCDSRQPGRRSHRVQNVVSRHGRRKDLWWQSENGVENVTIQLDLEAEFHFTHLIMTFKTFRPAALLIERSFDFGRTWRTYRYFAYDCSQSFPGVPNGLPRKVTDVVCDSRYSLVAPSTEGEVIFLVLPPSLHVEDPYSEEVQNLLKLTNLRINFTRLHTLGDDFLDQRDEIKEKYYYALYELVVRGSCSCYGHASRCVALPGDEGLRPIPDMVHGRCECTHNTTGLNCEQCEDLYNDLPWKPAIDRNINSCKRCNCNGHARKCHFDPAVFESTGRVSGGVCDDCEHNTMGRNCEHCRHFFYRDPARDISDPNICLPCDCDPRGSLDDGICDPRSDPEGNSEAGKCHCKLNVDGRRCDRCKNGFWNYQADNPEGCEPCSCNVLGTVGNQGCQQYSGECFCKRYVTGRDCNQCLPDHWGLSDDRDGCKPCDCDPGGAYDNSCDVGNGKCRCRPHVTGRRCDQTEQAYFAGLMDHLTYEAELSRGSPNCQVVVREPYGDRETTWTDLGFMKAYEGSHLEFNIDNIRTSMEYDLIIRYEPQQPGRWEDVKVTLQRPGLVDKTGPCANTIPQDDVKHTSLSPDQRHVVVYPPVCLEAGKRYTVRIELTKYSRQVDSPSASVLVDSVVLVPRIDGIPFFHGSSVNEYRRQEFERFRCGQYVYNVGNKSPIPEVCRQLLFSVGVYTYNEGLDCSCDPTGSVSAICNALGGQCQCKPNVVGRKCDRCAPGTHGFGPSGCRSCDCNSVGSLDNFCDETTGQCKCRSNTFGRQCDECQPGFWNYPTCRPCECNGHADTCDTRTGHCVDCQDYSAGPHCEKCEEGFYGDPRQGINIACRPCPCPGTPDSGHSYAQTCHLDPRTQNVVCKCEEGYAGERCDRCANNYYGNPSVAGGRCQACDCNNNIDESRPGNCDPVTGKCLQCLFNTEGFRCEKCKQGHWGDAVNQLCKECVCDYLGTDFAAGHCDQTTGQCHCLPNVVGLSCDECRPNHWKIASGEGCEACDCDPYGSVSEQCNLFDGQCHCKPRFGGRKCDQCQTNHWGDPNASCYPCDCNLAGSATLQCNRENGSCVCLKGIGGDKCDRCARGFTGRAPYCEPCGECFDNWDYNIGLLRDETLALLEEARKIKATGSPGVYTQQFAEMDRKLARVREILATANVTNADIEQLQAVIDQLRTLLSEQSDDLKDVVDKVDNTTQRIYDANNQLDQLRNLALQLKNDANDLKNIADTIKEGNVEGAMNITREAHKRSRAAQGKVDNAEFTLGDSGKERQRTESLMERARDAYNKTYAENQAALGDISNQIEALEDQIPGLNKAVCDNFGDPCDTLCGGAGCGKCGGLSCEAGAITKSKNALELARQADDILRDKDAKATELLNQVAKAKRDADEARDEAQKAYDKALAAKNRSEGAQAEVEDLVERIEKFLENDKAKPSEIRDLAQKTLALSISLRPEQIEALAKQIRDVIASLTDIDKILAATAGDLANARELRERANRAKKDAGDVLKTAQNVAKALEDAKAAQDKARAAIDKANGDIKATESDLHQIASETTFAQEVANKSVDDVEKLRKALEALMKQFVQNGLDVKKANDEANQADNLANRAQKSAGDLNDKYQKASDLLDQKAAESGTAKNRADDLRKKADELAQNTAAQMQQLKEMEDEFNENEKVLRDYSAELDRLNNEMMGHLAHIEEKSAFYRTCQP